MPEYKSFPLPDTAEGLTEAEILTWHVKPGDTVTVNQIIVEIETAKAAVELPCPWAGVVTELHVRPGQTVDVGTPILTIDTDPGGAAAPPPASSNGSAPAAGEEEMKPLVGYGAKAVTAKRRPRKGPAVPTEPAAAAAQSTVGAAFARTQGPAPDHTADQAPEAIPTARQPEPPARTTSTTSEPAPGTAGPATRASGPAAGGATGTVDDGNATATGFDGPASGTGETAAGGAAGTGHDGNTTPPGGAGTAPGFDGSASDSGATATRSVAGGSGARTSDAPESARGGHVPLAKPPVRKLAKDLGVDLRSLTGSGGSGVITRADVERAAAEPTPEPTPAAPTAPATETAAQAGERAATGPTPEPVPAAPTAPATETAARVGERRVPIKGVRKATAQAMVASAFTAPHVTEFLTVDVTPMMDLRARLAAHPDFRDVRLTPLAFCAKAVTMAVARTPEVNSAWDEAAQEIVFKDYVHLGIAAATPRGLIVPKVRNAETLSLRDLAVALEALTTTARDGKTQPADLVNGTITITNVGVFGVDTGTPIINPGESAILAFGAIRDMPWVVDGDIVVRKVCQLALSFDHRLVDGQQGSRFLADIGALLADPAVAFTY
ncbi:2-oxo acid dehydrogenase subunit E2 [Actinokineospora iranica]|uniref:Dihydrolipoamide acetyltransferase component of pyruvate dehydrogenase complex n=1 Tax=Actinokineospora iranica TaxID=1271860 RepID=A0A1G6Q1U9_9PSEU|nr:dihydrolipoamide acetyltransferase family protein [Actinokineospora iranica]SDC86191.1 pyruvate dehydrogenase E2 component (dihydrolipoamide acetyltransferase) [Actinokineospora iranica]